MADRWLIGAGLILSLLTPREMRDARLPWITTPVLLTNFVIAIGSDCRLAAQALAALPDGLSGDLAAVALSPRV